mmetsp:Transcript_84771/g.237366  ORF Transcript_84771/g.237366 Transcript_84771/m.237366 type:complete len:367 (+) Transcript_84771:862-1962(+)
MPALRCFVALGNDVRRCRGLGSGPQDEGARRQARGHVDARHGDDLKGPTARRVPRRSRGPREVRRCHRPMRCRWGLRGAGAEHVELEPPRLHRQRHQLCALPRALPQRRRAHPPPHRPPGGHGLAVGAVGVGERPRRGATAGGARRDARSGAHGGGAPWRTAGTARAAPQHGAGDGELGEQRERLAVGDRWGSDLGRNVRVRRAAHEPRLRALRQRVRHLRRSGWPQLPRHVAGGDGQPLYRVGLRPCGPRRFGRQRGLRGHLRRGGDLDRVSSGPTVLARGGLLPQAPQRAPAAADVLGRHPLDTFAAGGARRGPCRGRISGGQGRVVDDAVVRHHAGPSPPLPTPGVDARSRQRCVCMHRASFG